MPTHYYDADGHYVGSSYSDSDKIVRDVSDALGVLGFVLFIVFFPIGLIYVSIKLLEGAWSLGARAPRLTLLILGIAGLIITTYLTGVLPIYLFHGFFLLTLGTAVFWVFRDFMSGRPLSSYPWLWVGLSFTSLLLVGLLLHLEPTLMQAHAWLYALGITGFVLLAIIVPTVAAFLVCVAGILLSGNLRGAAPVNIMSGLLLVLFVGALYRLAFGSGRVRPKPWYGYIWIIAPTLWGLIAQIAVLQELKYMPDASTMAVRILEYVRPQILLEIRLLLTVLPLVGLLVSLVNARIFRSSLHLVLKILLATGAIVLFPLAIMVLAAVV